MQTMSARKEGKSCIKEIGLFKEYTMELFWYLMHHYGNRKVEGKEKKPPDTLPL